MRQSGALGMIQRFDISQRKQAECSSVVATLKLEQHYYYLLCKRRFFKVQQTSHLIGGYFLHRNYVSKFAWHELKDHSFHEESDRSVQALCSCTNAENMTPLRYDRRRAQALTKRTVYAQKHI